jgi:hypothetical protein
MTKELEMDWENTQKWADQKIAGLLAIAQRQGDKLIVGADPRDKLTTKEQQLDLIQQQAIALRQKVDQSRSKTTRPAQNLSRKSSKSAQDELFDMFAERLAKKMSELEKKKPQE